MFIFSSYSGVFAWFVFSLSSRNTPFLLVIENYYKIKRVTNKMWDLPSFIISYQWESVLQCVFLAFIFFPVMRDYKTLLISHNILLLQLILMNSKCFQALVKIGFKLDSPAFYTVCEVKHLYILISFLFLSRNDSLDI